MTRKNDFDLFFGIMLGAILAVLGNIMVMEIYGIREHPENFWVMVLSVVAFICMILAFWVLLLKCRK